MMKASVKAVSILMSSLALSSCQKEIPTTLSGYFYTTSASSSESGLTLYMDGENKGALPYIESSKEVPLSSKDSVLMAHALKFDFMSGTHIFQAKRADGSIVSATTMRFTYYKNKTEGSMTAEIGSAGNSMETDHSTVIWLGE